MVKNAPSKFQPSGSFAQDAMPPAPQRTMAACHNCEVRKIRCTGFDTHPEGRCTNCQRQQADCLFSPIAPSSSEHSASAALSHFPYLPSTTPTVSSIVKPASEEHEATPTNLASTAVEREKQQEDAWRNYADNSRNTTFASATTEPEKQQKDARRSLYANFKTEQQVKKQEVRFDEYTRLDPASWDEHVRPMYYKRGDGTIQSRELPLMVDETTPVKPESPEQSYVENGAKVQTVSPRRGHREWKKREMQTLFSGFPSQSPQMGMVQEGCYVARPDSRENRRPAGSINRYMEALNTTRRNLNELRESGGELPHSFSDLEKAVSELDLAHLDSLLEMASSMVQPSSDIGATISTASTVEQECNESHVLKSPDAYTQPFCEFLTENPTVFHAVEAIGKKLAAAGFKKVSERENWTSTLEKGGKYYATRNGSALIAFTVGSNYKSGNGVAMVAGHIDALTAKLKPISKKNTTAGYVQLGVAPYAGALNSTWWDRDLGIGGKVLVKDNKTGKIETKLVKLGWPIARIATLAPHFGVGMTGSENKETEMIPIIGLDNSSSSTTSEFENLTLGGVGSFTATQPPKLVRAIAGELSIQDYSTIVNWELELYDTQPAQVGGLDKEFIFAGRIDDKLCSWAAIEGLLASTVCTPTKGGETDDSVVKLVALFDDEEIGSLLRQGAKGNFLSSTVERITESFSPSFSANILAQTYANSFLISADVTHAVHPNFLSRYQESHAPRLNTGLVIGADSNGHLTTDSVSTALLTRVAEKTGSKLQFFAIRNDSRSGGTVGPELSSAMGVRTIDAGLPQLSMHSIRATTGALDPGLGVNIFAGFFEHYQGIDAEFE